MLPAFVGVGMVMIVRVAHLFAFRESSSPRTLQKTAATDQMETGTRGESGRWLRRVQLERENVMGSTSDKIKGTANEAIGKAKQGIGEATGSDRLQGEGAVQEVKGKGQKALGDAKEATKDAVNKAAAEANKKL
jgi:uncharacterized protein YjbJ (UPF0337 family)